MKWTSSAAVILMTALASCGNNSSDKEIVTIVDTTVGAPADTIAADTLNTMAVNVPEKTKTVFQKKYPEAKDVKWEAHKKETRGVEWDLTDWEDVDESGHNAWFHWQGNESKAYYNKQGDWVGTTDAITDPKTLPAAVTAYLNREFNGYKVSSVTRENDKSRTAYEVLLEKGGEKVKVLVDENGTMRKKKTVSGGVKTKEKN